MISATEMPRSNRYPERKIRDVSTNTRVLFRFGFRAAGIRKKMAAAARSMMLFNAIKMGFKVMEDQRMDNSNIMNRMMKKRLILLILFDSAWSIFSSIP